MRSSVDDTLSTEPATLAAQQSELHWHWLFLHEAGLLQGLTPQTEVAAMERILAARCADEHARWKSDALEYVLALAHDLHMPKVIAAVHARADNVAHPDKDALEALAELGDEEANDRLFTLRYGAVAGATRREMALTASMDSASL